MAVIYFYTNLPFNYNNNSYAYKEARIYKLMVLKKPFKH